LTRNGHCAADPKLVQLLRNGAMCKIGGIRTPARSDRDSGKTPDVRFLVLIG
jgi:hypothetical protein